MKAKYLQVLYSRKYICVNCPPHIQTFGEKQFNMQDIGPAPNNFLQDLLKLCRTGIYKILKFKRNQ
jgi:hypothetical protein